MDGDLVLSLVLFGFFFFGLFYCYYGAQVRIKREEVARSDSDRALLAYHSRRQMQGQIFGGGQEINTVSRHAAELRNQMTELPPEYSKVGGLPPAYDIVMAGNPPAYIEAIQLEIAVHENAQADLSSIVIAPTETVPVHTCQATSTPDAAQSTQVQH